MAEEIANESAPANGAAPEIDPNQDILDPQFRVAQAVAASVETDNGGKPKDEPAAEPEADPKAKPEQPRRSSAEA